MPVRAFALVATEVEGPHPASPAASGAARAAGLLGADLCALRPPVSPVGAPHALHWAHFQAAGVRLSLPCVEGGPSALSVAGYQWVRDRAPPRVLFADAEGPAQATLLAREAGLLPRGLSVGLLVLDPLRRRLEREGRAAADALGLMALHLEAEAARMADFFVFADTGLAEWFLAAHPAAAARPRHVLPGLAAAATPRPGAAEVVLDAVPWGAERRVAAFLDALAARLPGVPVRLPAPHNLTALLALAAPPALRLDLPEPVPEPLRPRRPPVGSVVVQTAGNAGPLAWDVPAAQVVALETEAAAAAAAETVAARLGAPDALPALADGEALRGFLAAQASPLPPLPPLPDPPPLVSVCLSHFNRPGLLRQALDSLAAQSWPNLEVVLVDDASPSATTREFLDALAPEFAARGWQLLRNERERWQAASRNRAVRAARGEFVLIMDDDNLALPQEVAVMLRAALATGAAAVAALQDLFRDGVHDPRAEGRAPWVAFFPMGGPPALGIAWNIFGDVNVLFRREVFLSLGGYSDFPEIGCEDYEIGAALALAGHRMVVLPEPLYQYRFSEQNMAKGMSNERLFLSHVRPLRPAVAAAWSSTAGRRLLALANGIEHDRQQRRRESYWAGADRPAPIPALGVPAAGSAPAEFRAKLAVLALAARERDRAAALAAALDDPARLHLALAGA